MPTVKEIISSFEGVGLKDFGARFYRADLHFHTPSSEDARGSNNYKYNPYKIVFPGKDTPGYDGKVKNIKEKVLEESREIARRMVERFMEEELGLVAITDHNGIGTIWNDPDTKKNTMDLAAPTWYELIDEEAQKVNKKEGKTVLTILPGVEISTSDIHILAIFPPQDPRRKVHFMICDLLNIIGFEVEEWGKNPEAGKTSVYNTIELVTAKGGLPIIAHADAHDKGLLKLYKINSTAMKDVLTNKNLPAIEIVNPSTFTGKNKKLKQPLSTWFRELRKKEGLNSFAYFQGSDAHSLKDIAKRSTYIKMTEPSFSGLKIAVNVPSSRVRLYDHLQEQEKNGLYIYGVEINHPYLKKCFVRFNRHLNCVLGKIESGKSLFFHLMQKPVNPDSREAEGSVNLFIEKKDNFQSTYYVIGNDSQSRYLYSINKEKKSADRLDWAQLDDLEITPRFYDPEGANPYITSMENFHEFLEWHFGPPTVENINKFNKMFSIDMFLEEKDRQVLYVEKDGDHYKLFLDILWKKGKEKKVEFSELDNSLRRIVLISILVISGNTGPLIIDTPEEHFNSDDIVNVLIPVLKKYKDFRQIILFTKHPVLAINSDPENYILLKRKGNKFNGIDTGFSIDKEEEREQLVKILEGSLSAFDKRVIRYRRG